MFDLMRIDPFENGKHLLRDFDRLMNDLVVYDDRGLRGASWLPDADIRHGDAEYTVSMDLPGVDPSEIRVEAEGRNLTVRGARNFSEVNKKSFSRSFERSFSLPAPADTGKISAVSENGVLTLTIPKREEAKPRRVEIEVREKKRLGD